jgi:hypothetical protein
MGFRCRVSGRKIAKSYETTPKWHFFLVIRLAAAMAWIKQRIAGYRITNFEGWNTFLQHSIFDIRFFRVSFSIKLAAFQASGWAET